MTNFLPFDGPVYDFFKNHYDNLRKEFFNEIYTSTQFDKPNYIRNNGVQLYNGKIDIIPLKLYRNLLDHNERRIANWADPNELYRYPLLRKNPDLYNKLFYFKKLLDTFENEIDQLFFNVAYPGSNLSYHYGVSKHAWRVHICFQNNIGFTFDIGGELKKWKEGIENSFKFDDGNLLHGVLYEDLGDNTPRIVCILDIKK